MHVCYLLLLPLHLPPGRDIDAVQRHLLVLHIHLSWGGDANLEKNRCAAQVLDRQDMDNVFFGATRGTTGGGGRVFNRTEGRR